MLPHVTFLRLALPWIMSPVGAKFIASRLVKAATFPSDDVVVVVPSMLEQLSVVLLSVPGTVDGASRAFEVDGNIARVSSFTRFCH